MIANFRLFRFLAPFDPLMDLYRFSAVPENNHRFSLTLKITNHIQRFNESGIRVRILRGKRRKLFQSKF